MLYSFNNFTLDVNNFLLSKNGRKIHVEPRVFDVIVYLVKNQHKVVTREELFENVWNGRDVLDATLSNHIKGARSILGDNGQSQHTIKTIHGRGYQFIANIKVLADNDDSNDKSNSNKTRINFSYIVALIIIALLTAFIYQTQFSKQSIDGTAQDKSIAVLAFLDMSPLKDQEYFSDGISEEILNKLAEIPGLRVISRTSSFFYKDKDTTVKEIGKQLNVSHILEGSIRKYKDKVRITVQLIESKTSSHLWSQTYDKEMNDIFQIQDDVALVISEKLKLSLFEENKTRPDIKAEAYNLYLHAKYLFDSRTKISSQKAESTINQSINISPNYAPSWFLLNRIIFVSTLNFGMRPFKDGMIEATSALNKTLKLDPSFAPAYAALSRIQSQQRNFTLSEINMNRALSLNSNNSFILGMASLNAMFSGQLNKAINYRLKLLKINPNNYNNYFNLGILYYMIEDYDTAYAMLEKYDLFLPNSAIHHYYMCNVLLLQGKYQLAIEKAMMETDEFWKNYAMIMALFSLNRTTESDQLLVDFISKYGQTDLANIARIYAYRGEKDKSFEWLNKAYEHPDTSLLEVLIMPDFKPMHNDPRWHEIIRRMDLPDGHWLIK